MRALVVKELRALTPIWLVAAGGAVAAVAAGLIAEVTSNTLRWSLPFQLRELVREGLEFGGQSAFVIGSVAVGAWCVGHEYAHRTLPLILAQPISRMQVFRAKVVVLSVLLAGLSLLALLLWKVTVPGDDLGGTGASYPIVPLLVLAPLLGLSVAPWTTILCRSSLGGAVISLAVPATLWLVGEIVRASRYGAIVPDDYSLSGTLMWTGTLATGTAVLIASPYQFRRLQALDDRGAAFMPRLPGRRGASADSVPASRRRHPAVALLLKELRLQSVTLLLPVLYVLAWIAIVVAGVGDYVLGSTFQGVTMIYVVLTASMLGAVASSEERAHGTLAVQLLQPMAFWKQWLVKAAAVFILTGALTIVLPALLERFHTLNDESLFDWSLVAAVVLCAAGGLYVSSLCSSGLRAILLTGAFLAAGLPLYSVATSLGTGIAMNIVPPEIWNTGRFLSDAAATGYDFSVEWAVRDNLPRAAWVGSVLLMIALGAANHRSVEGTPSRWRLQLWLPATVALGAAAVGAAPLLVRWYVATH